MPNIWEILWFQNLFQASVEMNHHLDWPLALLKLFFLDNYSRLLSNVLITFLLVAAHQEFAKHWKESGVLCVNNWTKKVWDLALSEHFTQELRCAQGILDANIFDATWFPFITYVQLPKINLPILLTPIGLYGQICWPNSVSDATVLIRNNVMPTLKPTSFITIK